MDFRQILRKKRKSGGDDDHPRLLTSSPVSVLELGEPCVPLSPPRRSTPLRDERDEDDQVANHTALRIFKRRRLLMMPDVGGSNTLPNEADGKPKSSGINLRHRTICEDTALWLGGPSLPANPLLFNADSLSDGDNPVQELWLGPVFESPSALFAAISTMPSTVTHLDLDLRNVLHLLPRALSLLFQHQHAQITHLCLRFCGDEHGEELARWIPRNRNLRSLNLSSNRIGSTGAHALVKALVRCEHPLEKLILNGNCIRDCTLVNDLLSAPSCRLKTLDLRWNWLGEDDLAPLLEGLTNNSSLRELLLMGCARIRRKGMGEILECLQSGQNTTLHRLEVQTFTPDESRTKGSIDYWLRMNRAGRRLLRQEDALDDDDCPRALWGTILERSNASPEAIYFLLQQAATSRML